MQSNPDRWNIKSGRIDVEGLFKISSTGIVFANDERHHHSPLINREGGNNFIELMELGAGNGGAVFKVSREGGWGGRGGGSKQPERLHREKGFFPFLNTFSSPPVPSFLSPGPARADHEGGGPQEGPPPPPRADAADFIRAPCPPSQHGQHHGLHRTRRRRGRDEGGREERGEGDRALSQTHPRASPQGVTVHGGRRPSSAQKYVLAATQSQQHQLAHPRCCYCCYCSCPPSLPPSRPPRRRRQQAPIAPLGHGQREVAVAISVRDGQPLSPPLRQRRRHHPFNHPAAAAAATATATATPAFLLLVLLLFFVCSSSSRGTRGDAYCLSCRVGGGGRGGRDGGREREGAAAGSVLSLFVVVL